MRTTRRPGQPVLEGFGPLYVYEVARTRWRLAEALAQAGDRAAAQEQWDLAAQIADRLRAAPLRRALADLARRARLDDPGAHPTGRQRPGARPTGPGPRCPR